MRFPVPRPRRLRRTQVRRQVPPAVRVPRLNLLSLSGQGRQVRWHGISPYRRTIRLRRPIRPKGGAASHQRPFRSWRPALACSRLNRQRPRAVQVSRLSWLPYLSGEGRQIRCRGISPYRRTFWLRRSIQPKARATPHPRPFRSRGLELACSRPNRQRSPAEPRLRFPEPRTPPFRHPQARERVYPAVRVPRPIPLSSLGGRGWQVRWHWILPCRRTIRRRRPIQPKARATLHQRPLANWRSEPACSALNRPPLWRPQT
jgi:hypothetical protein